MPPVRSIPSVKPIKTERTHEENQERAYIAASRRSDRSLEARIESARRASEIHKKRTGRALRVTEQDVVNEEMYEEEDEDLPAQYRRLTAHLQTGSLDFNRRFHAYLLSQHGARSALANLDTSATPNYMQYPNAPYFANPMMQPLSPQVTSPNAMPASPQSYRHAPYPVMASPNKVKIPQHHRSASMSTPQELQQNQQSQQSIKPPQPVTSNSEEFRRQSMPPQSMAAPLQRSQSAQSRPSLSRNGSTADNVPKSATLPTSSSQLPQAQPNFDYLQNLSSPMHFNPYMQSMNFGPFTTAMPLESQMFINPAADPMMCFGGTAVFPQPISYTYNPNLDVRPKPSTNTSTGMEQTLTTGMPTLDSNADPDPSSDSQLDFTVGGDDFYSSLAPSYGLGLDDGFGEPMKAPAMTRNSSQQDGVDGSNDWASLINGSMWEETAT